MNGQRLRKAARAATEIQDGLDVVFFHKRGKDIHPKIEDLGPMIAPTVITKRYPGGIVVHQRVAYCGETDQLAVHTRLPRS